MIEQIAERTPLFGTGGIRGIVGEDLSVGLCHGLGKAIGTSLTPGSRVCLATDTRESRDLIKSAVASGLLATGVNVVDLDILPTPALALLTREMQFDTGVMLTASHNPPEYNGIKLFNRDAVGYSIGQQEEIEDIYFERRFRTAEQGKIQAGQGMKEKYLQFLQGKLPDKHLNNRLKVVVDPGNGAASGFASDIFSQMGVNLISINDEPDGHFPERNPEPREDTLQGTVDFLRKQDADLAICFDGDADRVVFCDKEGFLGFNEMLAFISRLMIQETGRKTVATTVETGRFLDLALNDLGGKVVRGKVGDVNVAYLARELDAALGVEQVGVYIIPELGYYPDSFFTALFLLSHLTDAAQIRQSFQDMPRLFFKKDKVPCPNELKQTVMARVTDRSSSRNSPSPLPLLAWFPLSLRAKRNNLAGVTGEHPILNTIDGLRLELSDSWMLIRPSGTEPAIRVIAESTSRTKTDELVTRGAQLIQSIVGRS